MTPERIAELNDWAKQKDFRKQSHWQLITMKSYMNKPQTNNPQVLYKLVGGFEHHLVSCSDYQLFPMLEDTIALYAALGDDDAIRLGKSHDIIEDEDTVRYILKVKVNKVFIDGYPETLCGPKDFIRREWRFWTQSKDALNRHIVGRISVICMLPPKKHKCLACGGKTYDATKNIYFPFCDEDCKVYYDPYN